MRVEEKYISGPIIRVRIEALRDSQDDAKSDQVPLVKGEWNQACCEVRSSKRKYEDLEELLLFVCQDCQGR